MIRLALLLAICFSMLRLSEAAHAQVPGREPHVSAPARAMGWNAERESWYRRNRGITITGKVATIAGVAMVFTGAFVDNVVDCGSPPRLCR